MEAVVHERQVALDEGMVVAAESTLFDAASSTNSDESDEDDDQEQEVDDEEEDDDDEEEEEEEEEEDEDDEDDEDQSSDASATNLSESEVELLGVHAPDDHLAEGWALYTDENTGHPYYFNHHTGASQWHRPDIPSRLQHRRAMALQQTWLGDRASTAVLPCATAASGPIKQAHSTLRAGRNEDPDGLGDDASDSDDLEDLDDPDDPDRIESQADVESAVTFYVVTSLLHVLAIEAPLAAFEGLGRGGYRIVVGAVLLVLAAIQRSEEGQDVCRRNIRSGVELFAAGLTLMVPGSAIFAYSDMLSAWRDGRLAKSARVDDWRLGVIPSLAGPVDARKLRAISNGQGAHAMNVRNLRERV